MGIVGICLHLILTDNARCIENRSKHCSILPHCNPVQGQYRARTGFSLCSKFSQGKTCFHYREPLFSLQGPCIHYRDFPVRITTQGDPSSHYREWVCSIGILGKNQSYFIFSNLKLHNRYYHIQDCHKKSPLYGTMLTRAIKIRGLTQK